MGCDTRYATATQFANFFCLELPLSTAEEAAIESALDIAAGPIHLARLSVGGCDCTLSAGGTAALAYLNMLLAVVFRKCPCARVSLSDSERMSISETTNEMLAKIMRMELEPCQGETGALVPSIGWAELNLTEFSEMRIRYNTFLRSM